MSGVVKAVKKEFKRVNDSVKKLWKNKIVRAIIIAVAVYFTAGAALGYFGASGTAVAAGAVGESAGAVAAGIGEGIAAGEGATAAMSAAEISAATAGVAEGEAVGSVLGGCRRSGGTSDMPAAAAGDALARRGWHGCTSGAADSGDAPSAGIAMRQRRLHDRRRDGGRHRAWPMASLDRRHASRAPRRGVRR
jgi:hypothetical protein